MAFNPPTDKELQLAIASARNIVEDALPTSETTTHEEDPRSHLKGLLNPNFTTYNLPRSKTRYVDIFDVICNKPYKAYYPQSSVTLPDYFTNSGIEPFVRTRPIDDYAWGVMTIENMVMLYSAGVRWRFANLDDVTEVIDNCSTFLREFTPARCAQSAVTRNQANVLREFISELTAFRARSNNAEYISAVQRGDKVSAPMGMLFKMMS